MPIKNYEDSIDSGVVTIDFGNDNTFEYEILDTTSTHYSMKIRAGFNEFNEFTASVPRSEVDVSGSLSKDNWLRWLLRQLKKFLCPQCS